MRLWRAPIIAVFSLVTATAFADEKPFEAVEIRTEGPIWGRVMVAPLIRAGEPAMMLLHREDGRHWLTIYNPAADGGWLRPLVRQVQPQPDDLFYDIVSTGKDHPALLAMLGSDGVRLVDPGSAVEIARISLDHIYRGESNPEFGRLEFAHDVDGDGRDDLLIPDFDGMHLVLQRADGSFAEPRKLDFRPEMRVSSFDDGAPGYRGFPMKLADVDGDGNIDIVFLRGRSLVWFRNPGTGEGFDTAPREIETGLKAVGNRWVDELEADRSRASDADFVETRIIDFEDIDGDGRLDLLTETETVRGTFDRDVRYGLHYGREEAGKPGYSVVPDAEVTLDGFTARRRIVDLDGDGRRDFVAASLDIGLGKVIGALFSGSTNVDLAFFRLDANGRYPARPNLKRKARVDFGFSSGAVEVPVFLTADLSGSGRHDLVLADGRGKLNVYHGIDDQRLFADRGHSFAISLPKDGGLVEAEDIDDDGREDLIVRYDPRGRDMIEARNRLILLFSR